MKSDWHHTRSTSAPSPKLGPCPREWALLDWMAEDEKSYRLARLIKLTLGRLPQRIAKFGRANFDLEETREYGLAQDGRISGQDLAGIAAHIVRRAARHPIDYLMSLRGIPAAIAEPIKTYLRVKLALGRLENEIEKARFLAEYSRDTARTVSPKHSPPAKPSIPPRPRTNLGNSSEVALGADSLRQEHDVSAPDKPKAYVWNISPAQGYGFKDMTAAYGYDPRDTSAYWIERRAAALRRKWAAYRKAQSGDDSAVRAPDRCEVPQARTARDTDNESDDTDDAPLRYFEPVDADYNTVWPPVKLPDGPPKPPARSTAAVRTPVTATLHAQRPNAEPELERAERSSQTTIGTANCVIPSSLSPRKACYAAREQDDAAVWSGVTPPTFYPAAQNGDDRKTALQKRKTEISIRNS